MGNSPSGTSASGASGVGGNEESQQQNRNRTSNGITANVNNNTNISNNNNSSGNRNGQNIQGLRIQTDDETAANITTAATAYVNGSNANNNGSGTNTPGGSRFRNFVGRALSGRLSSSGGPSSSSANGNLPSDAVDDKSESSVDISNDDHFDSSKIYCFIKAKTRLHGSKKVIRRSSWFECKEGKFLRFGSADECEMKLNDERCSPINASLLPNILPPLTSSSASNYKDLYFIQKQELIN